METKKYIQKIISEEVKKLLDEDYESIKEVAQIANDVLKTLAKKNINLVLQYKNEDISGYNFFKPVILKDAFHKSQSTYNKLALFLVKTNIEVHLLPKKENHSGSYSYIHDPIDGYNPNTWREIYIFYDDNFINYLQETQNVVEDFKSSNLHSIFQHYFISSLKHEIQHAYDDYRSKGKMFDSKEFREFIENDTRQKESESKEESKKEFRKYLNFPHEIWARFTQTITNLDFTNSDLVEGNDGHYYLKYKMKSLIASLIAFYNSFYGWGLLYDKNGELSNIQRRLQRAVIQFWYKEQERITEENKNPRLFY